MDLINSETRFLFDQLGADNVRFVGGCVRDYLLDKQINDIDLATTHTPQQVKNILSKNSNIKIIDSGIKFGTLTLIFNNKTLEITTLRKDISCDGRRADVVFSQKWREDALRRDFTINALYMDIEGEIYDFFDGINDLKNGVVKFIGNAEDRIKEDYLRILRFVRFSLFYSKGELDKNSFDACLKLSTYITNLSKERIRSELFKIIAYQDSFQAFELLKNINILQIVFGEVFDIEIFNKQSKYLDDAIFKIAMLLRASDKITIKQLLEKISFSNKELLYLRKNIECFQIIEKIEFQQFEDKIKYIIQEFGNDITLKSLHILACEKFMHQAEINTVEKFVRNYEIKKLPVNGNDFINLGVTEGRNIKKALDIARKIWIENDQKISKLELILKSNNILAKLL